MPPPRTPFTVFRLLSTSSRLLSQSTPRFASRIQPSPQLPLPLPARQLQFLPSKRFHSTVKTPKPLTDAVSEPSSHKPKYMRPPQPEYQITFTCTPCSTRSSHKISKQGYHKGSVLVTCPECKNRHVISDHLNIFGDKHFDIEDLMKEKGMLVKRGTLSENGDIEFWEDENGTKKEESSVEDGPVKQLP